MSSEILEIALIDELDSTFAAYPAAGYARGLVYGLVGPKGLEHSRGFGASDDSGTCPDLDTVFPIASMTKSFVACAALIARDRGLIDLDAPITRYVPEFTASAPDGEVHAPPTVRMLLSMSGGLTEDNSWVDPLVDVTVDELLTDLTEGVLYSHAPGSVYEYSNLGYSLAGIAVGRAVGASIEDFVMVEICEPLGLKQTWFDGATPDHATWSRGVGYSLDTSGRWVAYPFAPSGGGLAAAGGMMSTVRDLARWVQWLASAFRPAGEDEPSILDRASRRELQRLHQVDVPSLTALPSGSLRISVSGYALGLVVTNDIRRGVVVSHAGGVPGYKLFMCWHPDSGVGMVCLTNSHRGDPNELTRQALMMALDHDDVAARTIRLWPETVELRLRAESLVRQWDDAMAEQIFAANIDFDRPLSERRRAISDMIEAIGPLDPPRPVADVTSASSPADITWTISGQRGELVCMIHVTPVRPVRIQEFEVHAVTYERPRSDRPNDISDRRRLLRAPSMNSLPHTRIVLP